MMHLSERARGGPVTRPVGVRHLFRSCAGTTALEFALVALPFVMLLLGVIDFSRFIWTQSTLQFTVEKAARCAAVNTTICGTTAQMQNYALSQQVLPSEIQAQDFKDNPSTCSSSVPGKSVSISKNFTFTIPQLMPFAMTLKAQSCYPK